MRSFAPVALIALAACAASADPAPVADAPSATYCATPAERAAVAEFYAAREGAPPPIANAALGLAEQTVVSALPAENAVSAGPEHFDAVWRSASAWDGVITQLVALRGNHMRFPGPMSTYRENTRGDAYYDVKPDARLGGLNAHFRPDLMTAIYAVDLPGRGGASRAVIFFDATGASVIGLYATVAGEPEPEGRVDAFQDTWDLVAGLPDVCTDEN